MNKKIKLIIIIWFLFAGLIYLLENSLFVNRQVFSFINPFNPISSNALDTEKTRTNLEQWKDPRGLFPIFAYNVPFNSSNLTASLRIIEKGGINIIVNGNFGWMPDPLKLKEAFRELTNSNLRWIAIIENECKDDFIYNNWNDETNKNILKYLDLFNDDFVYGWYIWDEPGKNRKLCSLFNLIPNNDFEDINRMVKQIRSNTKYKSKLDFINLFPTYWSETKTIGDYENYLNTFYNSQDFKPRVLCFDHYPFLKKEKGGFRKDYFSNLEIIRKKSNQWNIPFWMIVLSSGHDNYVDPTFDEIRFQVFSALAYGAKGIGYYLYSKSFEQLGYSSWILENFVDNENVADSLHGKLYLPVKKLNEQIQKIGQILWNSRSVGIIHTTDFPNEQTNLVINSNEYLRENYLIDSISSLSFDYPNPDLILGIFEDVDQPEIKNILVVNKNYLRSTEVKINFIDDFLLKKLDKNTGEINTLGKVHSVDTFLEAGDAELFIVKIK